MFKTILAPVTPSASCEQAADAAISLAKRFGSELVIIHVHGFEHRWGEAELLAAPGELKDVREGIGKHFAARLEGVAAHSFAVEQGVPHVEILRKARELGADLIVMCPHRRELPRMPKPVWNSVGNTTERVISLSQCPVMLVNRPLKREEPVLASILATTGLTVKDQAGVHYAAQLARKSGARLTVLNVLDTDTPEGNAPQEGIARVIGERKDRMASEYGGMVQGVAGVEYECLEGQTVVEILKAARTRRADAIVMAHLGGEEDLDCAFELSTVIHVACTALCPVVSVNRKFDMPG
ncbi:MAG: universal stress protein [Thermodesulfobacteriota bacterium]